jgi:hypothetical protein
VLEPNDPVRLVELGNELDPDLRSALERISADLPSSAQISALNQSLSAALHQAPLSVSAAKLLGKALWIKVVGTLVISGLGLFAVRTLMSRPSAAPTLATATPSGAPGAVAVSDVRQTRAASGSSATREAHREQFAERAEPTVTPLGLSVAAGAESGNRAEHPAHTADAVQESRAARGSDPAIQVPQVRGSAWRGAATAAITARTERGARAISERVVQEPTGEPNEAAASELALIAEAQRAVTRDAHKALRLLDQHAHDYPSGVFAEERDALRIDALSRLGTRAALVSRARAFLSAYPASLHRARIEALLEASERAR